MPTRWGDERRVALLDAVLDRLIPADEHGPGAVDAGVSTYVTRTLAGVYAEHVPAYERGLDAIDACSERRHGRAFTALAPGERDAILADMERGAAGTGLPDEAAAFALIRLHAIEGMFGDPAWGGNRDEAGWRLLGYPGPRAVWTRAEQDLDVLPAPR